MGSLSDAFSALHDVILADYRGLANPQGTLRPRRAAERDILVSRLLRTFSAPALKFGSGSVVDALDRQVGPFDLIAHADNYPSLGDAYSSLFLSDGVVYTLGISHEWSEGELTTFSDMASQLKTLQRKNTAPLFCGIVDFGGLPYPTGSKFLQLPIAHPIDFIYSVGQYCIIRNAAGWYGSAEDVPFVTERGGPEALKSFAMLQLQIAQYSLGLPFSYADYQHL